MANRATNFVILIGGPGKFVACDRAHDQTWKNYVVPIQLATSKNLLAVGKGETIHWWVYGPAYTERWEDDVAYVSTPKPVKPGENLFDSRKQAINAIRAAKAVDYLGRIRQIAAGLGVNLKVLDKPDDFWQGLKSFPDGSVSRIWYIGHASTTGLMLKLGHNALCQPSANMYTDMILKDDIIKSRAAIGRKLGVDPTKSSRFYGCFTAEFARQWHDVFAVSTEGAINKIDFGVIDKPSAFPNVLDRLEHSNPDTEWKNFSSP